MSQPPQVQPQVNQAQPVPQTQPVQQTQQIPQTQPVPQVQPMPHPQQVPYYPQYPAYPTYPVYQPAPSSSSDSTDQLIYSKFVGKYCRICLSETIFLGNFGATVVVGTIENVGHHNLLINANHKNKRNILMCINLRHIVSISIEDK